MKRTWSTVDLPGGPPPWLQQAPPPMQTFRPIYNPSPFVRVPGTVPFQPPRPKPRPRREKKVKRGPVPIKNMVTYRTGNYRGALQEYFQRRPDCGIVTLEFDTEEEPRRSNREPRVFLAHCRPIGYEEEGDEVGVGWAAKKKDAVQFAALDLILKLKLITVEDHKRLHPEENDEEDEEEEEEEETKEEAGQKEENNTD